MRKMTRVMQLMTQTRTHVLTHTQARTDLVTCVLTNKVGEFHPVHRAVSFSRSTERHPRFYFLHIIRIKESKHLGRVIFLAYLTA